MPRAGQLKLPEASKEDQTEHKRAWNRQRSHDDADFYTIGYSGRGIDTFLDALTAAGVVTLVDVRITPVSMYKPEFSKSNLARALSERGIAYLHVPELGVPRDVRAEAIDTGSRAPIWRWYDENVVSEYIGRNLHHFLNFADHPIVLMCTELDPTACHRHRLSVALEKLGLRSYDL